MEQYRTVRGFVLVEPVGNILAEVLKSSDRGVVASKTMLKVWDGQVLIKERGEELFEKLDCRTEEGDLFSMMLPLNLERIHVLTLLTTLMPFKRNLLPW